MWDVFISHASEDKETVVRQLAKLLIDAGLQVWYDESALGIGDGLRRSIEYGLANSRFGVVILSPAFFRKEWPQRELDALTSIEIRRGKHILPVWHDLTSEDILRQAPLLADKLAISTKAGLPHVAQQIVKVVRPELVSKISMDSETGTMVLQHDKLFSHQAVRRHVWIGSSLMLFSLFLLVLSLRLANGTGFQAVVGSRLSFAALLGTASGMFLVLAAVGFRDAHQENPILSIEVEKIGGYILPFDSRFMAQWQLGPMARFYRLALVFEVFSLSCLWGAVLAAVWAISSPILMVWSRT